MFVFSGYETLIKAGVIGDIGVAHLTNSRIPSCMILLSYIVVRLVWEVYAFPITMSRLYAILNFSVLMPLLFLLLIQLYTGFANRVRNCVLSVLCLIYLGSYLVLGVLVYPLMLTPRFQPKSLFIDAFTVWNVLFAFVYSVYRLSRRSADR